MKRFILLLLLLPARSLFAQQTIAELKAAEDAYTKQVNALGSQCPNCPSCSSIPPWTIIDSKLANKRIAKFAFKCTRTHQEFLGQGIPFSIKGILAMLDTVIQNNGSKHKQFKYDGFRAYFANFPTASEDTGNNAPTDQQGKLSFIFVPTTRDKNILKWNVHHDDTKTCMVIDGDGVKVLPWSTVKPWIIKAQTGCLQKFETDGKDQHKHWPLEYKETHSLWYARWVLGPNCLLRNGLIDILNCHLCCDSKTIFAYYAAFLDGRLRSGYQLSLVFKLSNQTGSFFLSLNGLDDPPTGGSDTGNPCPPPSNCNTVGASQ